MIFRQIPHDDLGCASYLIGDDDAGVAAVVDPKFEIDEYLELARYIGVSIRHILETHNHADHVSGHGKLAAASASGSSAGTGSGSELRVSRAFSEPPSSCSSGAPRARTWNRRFWRPVSD